MTRSNTASSKSVRVRILADRREFGKDGIPPKAGRCRHLRRREFEFVRDHPGRNGLVEPIFVPDAQNATLS